MARNVEWRNFGEFDVLLLVEDGEVREAMTANAEVLHDFLAVLFTGVTTLKGDRSVEAGMRRPEAWGTLIMARAEDGQILDVDPERFWAGVHIWFRSRGVDYDTPVPRGGAQGAAVPR